MATHTYERKGRYRVKVYISNPWYEKRDVIEKELGFIFHVQELIEGLELVLLSRDVVDHDDGKAIALERGKSAMVRFMAR